MPPLRSQLSGSLLRRDLYPTAGLCEGAAARPARTTATGRLRVSPSWRPQHLPDLRTASRLAPRGDYPAAHHAGLRSPDAVAGGPSLSQRPNDPRGLDSLNTRRMASLYETFPAAEAWRIAKQLEFHHTPKHASWLNRVPSLPKGWRRLNSARGAAPAQGQKP